MKQTIKNVVRHEKEHWDNVFQSEIKNDTEEKYSSYWWQNYYEDISNNLSKLLKKSKCKAILEAGSGSGKATLLLKGEFSKTLFDISSSALEYAQILSKKFRTKNPKTVEGNLFEMPFKNKSFDFVWNIGVVEHYPDKHIVEILREMIRVCTNSGMVAIGLPNFYSGPILKAAILNWKIFHFVPGYRLDTERFFSASKIEELFDIACQKEQRGIEYFDLRYFGSPLIMELSEKIFRLINPVVSSLLPKNKFLILVICKLKKGKNGN